MANDENIISEWARETEKPRPVRIFLSQDSRSEAFREFADRMQNLAPAVGIMTEYEADDSLPEIRIKPNITYQAVPQGHELKPFLEILSGLNKEAQAWHLSDTDVLEKISMPAIIKVYISPECPFCPQTVQLLASLAMHQEMIHLVVIDGFMFSEKAAADKVSSVPTVFLDDQFRWTGNVQLPELIDILVNRDPAHLSSETLKQILYDGKASDLAKMMADWGKVFPGIYSLLTHTEWPVRLGAMATVEYLGEHRKDLIADVVNGLWEQFEELDEPVKADILYLFGETAHPEARPKIEAVLAGDYSDLVKEAANEAMAAF
ncbi:MAG TPA: thioredoxin family protein [Desulfosalsimonadaceae bacterium]|nr:thioredoxin family protein [Desulfosalsimonadaceae bacterium]